MIYISICDDDADFTSYVEKIIYKVIKKNQSVRIDTYESGESFIAQLDGKKCDLLILDMQMKIMDGNITAKYFRQKYPNAVLIFCSDSLESTGECFKVRAFRYLYKNMVEQEFMNEMKIVLDETNRLMKKEYLYGHYRGKVAKIYVKDIMYFQNAKRGSQIFVIPDSEIAKHMDIILIDKKLSELEEMYDDFVSIHNGYLVNMEHIDYYDRQKIFLDTGEELPISRSYRQSFLKRFEEKITYRY